jgi:Raf kinase inhibitor-like YbhB/YbcL family protein
MVINERLIYSRGEVREVKIRYVNLLCVAVVICLAIYTNRVTSKVKGIMQSIQVTSTAFKEKESIPDKYTCKGDNQSPPLEWKVARNDALKSFAIVCRDPDAPGHTWVHWVLFNIPAETTSIPENVSPLQWIQGVKQGRNSWGKKGYGGPCPPSRTHRYIFTVYGLDTILNVSSGASYEEVMSAMQGHIRAQGQLIGMYSASLKE